MKTLNECQCCGEFENFIHSVIKQSGYTVQQLRIMYCGPKSIYLCLRFYDPNAFKGNEKYGDWIEREMLLRYRKHPKKNSVNYKLTWGLDADGELVCRGTYACSDGFPTLIS